MRGTAARQAMMLTAVTPDALVPHRHPIRQIKPIVDAALAQMSPTFERMYAQDGRPSISDRKSNREPNERKAPARCSGVVTDQHEGERVAVAAVTRAVAGRCGENAADKGADSGWMRLDEDCGGRGRAEKQRTAPADRPVRDPARPVAFTTAVAIGGAGSVHRRNGMRAARALPGDRNGPGSPPATDCRQNPPPVLPAIQTRCSADHHPAWGCEAGPDVRRTVGVCVMPSTRGSHLTSGIWQGTLCPKRGSAK